MTRYGVFISVENYRHFPDTSLAHADSNLVYSTFTELCDYSSENALLLNLDSGDNTAPESILSEIRGLLDKTSPGDSILLYFAGHGHYEDGKTYLILPNTVPGGYKKTALALDDIAAELGETERSFYRIFDACHTGTVAPEETKQLDTESFLREVTQLSPNSVTLAACKENQHSVSDPEIGHGVFTYYLCRYISNLEEDRPIYPEFLLIEIADEVQEHAGKLGCSQSPTLSSSVSGTVSLGTRRAKSVPVQAARSSQPREENGSMTPAADSRMEAVRQPAKAEREKNLVSMISDFNKQTAKGQARSYGEEQPVMQGANARKKMSSQLIQSGEERELVSKILDLKKKKDIVTEESIAKLFDTALEGCSKSLLKLNNYDFEITCGPQLSVEDIPADMVPSVVEFARHHEFSCRHRLNVTETESESSPHVRDIVSARAPGGSGGRKEAVYHVSQPPSMPLTAVVFDLRGDGRCVPSVHILLYLMPLQITACLLASTFQREWPPYEAEMNLLCHAYRFVKPQDSYVHINEIGPAVAAQTMERITQVIKNRVDLLERELAK